jgi:membrane protein YqaA with SNARE-associated domain
MRRGPLIPVLLALFALALAVPLVLGLPQAGGLGTFALFTLWCNGPWSPLLPAFYEPVLLATGRNHGALPVAIVGTAATLAVEWANYYVHSAAISSERLAGLRAHRATSWLSERFGRRPFFYVWLCAWSPLPYWPVRTLAPLAGLSVGKHLLATGIGRFPRLWFIAAVGAVFQPPLWSLAIITLAPVVIALVAWHRQRRSREVVPAVAIAVDPSAPAHHAPPAHTPSAPAPVDLTETPPHSHVA